MAYDYIGRRFEYKETMNGTLTRHDRYLYRGYLQIAAQDILNSASVKHAIAWDPTEPTATRPLALHIGAESYFYSFDQVKNVTELFDSTGTLAATYDYSPFGQVVVSTGAVPNPLTFSSEVLDSALGLQYYNCRHLNVLDGRWVSRDMREDWSDINLYSFALNNSLLNFDLFGFLTESQQKQQNRCQNLKGVIEKHWKTTDPVLDDLIEKLKNKGMPFSVDCNPCCTEKTCGSSSASGCSEVTGLWLTQKKCNVIVCGNRTDDSYRTIRHELTHCLQYDDGWKKSDCKSCMCREIQAWKNGDNRVPKDVVLESAFKSCKKACKKNSEDDAKKLFSDADYKTCQQRGRLP